MQNPCFALSTFIVEHLEKTEMEHVTTLMRADTNMKSATCFGHIQNGRVFRRIKTRQDMEDVDTPHEHLEKTELEHLTTLMRADANRPQST